MMTVVLLENTVGLGRCRSRSGRRDFGVLGEGKLELRGVMLRFPVRREGLAVTLRGGGRCMSSRFEIWFGGSR